MVVVSLFSVGASFPSVTGNDDDFGASEDASESGADVVGSGCPNACGSNGLC